MSKVHHLAAQIDHRPFGRLPDGRPVRAFTLKVSNGIEVEVLNYGGIISRWLLPDASGQLADIVLGFNSLKEYRGSHPFFGVIAGRVAGRIPSGKLRLGGEIYDLPINDPPNHLHGGPDALDKKLWAATPLCNADGSASLELRYHSLDGEAGYPGTVDLTATYTLHPDGTFDFATEARSESVATPVSLTQHSYFNLGGEGSGTVESHTLQICSDQIIPNDEDSTPTGRLESVDGTPADLRRPRRIGEFAPKIWQNHGDLYWLGADDFLKPAAQLHDPASGRTLVVQTTQRCLQTYLAPGLNGAIIGKSGRPYPSYGAVCLECEGYPDATNTPGFGSILVHPGTPQKHLTRYTFSAAPHGV